MMYQAASLATKAEVVQYAFTGRQAPATAIQISCATVLECIRAVFTGEIASLVPSVLHFIPNYEILQRYVLFAGSHSGSTNKNKLIFELTIVNPFWFTLGRLHHVSFR